MDEDERALVAQVSSGPTSKGQITAARTQLTAKLHMHTH